MKAHIIQTCVGHHLQNTVGTVLQVLQKLFMFLPMASCLYKHTETCIVLDNLLLTTGTE